MDETIDYDVFTYHDLSSRTELGMGAKLSLDGETWEVTKVTPPVHEGREGSALLQGRARAAALPC